MDCPCPIHVQKSVKDEGADQLRLSVRICKKQVFS